MKYICKLCNGKGKQSSGLSCISCRGERSFDITGNIEECSSCKGTGRAAIRTLPCVSCGGKGFLIKNEQQIEERQVVKKEIAPEEAPVPTPESVLISETKTLPKKRKIARRKKAVIQEEFGEEHLDSLQEKLTDILESP